MQLKTITLRPMYVFLVIVLVAGLFSFFMGTEVVQAQSNIGPGGFVTCDGYNCSACDLVSMVNEIIKWLFGFMFLVFAALMVRAGFGLVTSGGNQSALESAKSIFKNSIIGILIVMSAWLIVDTVMRGLVGGGATGAKTGEIVNWGPWAQVQCAAQIQTTAWARSATDAIDPAIITPPSTPPAAGTLTHAQAAAQLSGLTVTSSGNCTDRTNRRCTSLDGIRPLTIQRINELRALVGYPLIITGGTEVGHAAGTYSHANGYKIDLRIDPILNNYIRDNFTKVPGSNNRWKDGNGNVYYRHGPPDHWDITITN